LGERQGKKIRKTPEGGLPGGPKEWRPGKTRAQLKDCRIAKLGDGLKTFVGRRSRRKDAR